MEAKEKNQIASEVKRLSSQQSQNRIAKRVGVSSATISHIIQGKWEQIKPELWRKIKVKLRIDLSWNIAKTALFEDLTYFCNSAKEFNLTVAFAHQAGTGKTTFYTAYQKQVPNVIYVQGDRSMSKKTYIKKLLTNAGQDSYGTTEQLLERFIDHVSELDKPLIIIDQFDKLKETTFDLFMDFYNELHGHCGFVISGVKALDIRMERGVKRNKIGYEEIWSRMDRKFINLPELSLNDVKLIFKENGVDDLDVAHESFNTCEGDIRRVRKDVLKYKLDNV